MTDSLITEALRVLDNYSRSPAPETGPPYMEGGRINEAGRISNLRLNAKQMADCIASLLKELEACRADAGRLEKLVYVPGLTRCAKCGFELISNFLCADTGRIAANNTPQQCANGCGPMWKVTEREASNRAIDRLHERIMELIAERDYALRPRHKLLLALNAAVSWMPGRSPDPVENLEISFVREVVTENHEAINAAISAKGQSHE